MRVALLALAGLVVLNSSHAACAPTRHRVAPYRDDVDVASGLEERAAAYCRAVQPDAAAPPRRFRTDGCTCWWNDGWTDCCVDHDMRYWCGGPRGLRRAADAELHRCVGAHHSEIVAFLMYLGTRLFAASWVPAHWRWGYGWGWPRAGPDTAEEVHARPVPVEVGAEASVTAREPAELSGAALCVSRADPP